MKSEKLVIVGVCILIVLFVIACGFLIGSDYVADPTTFFVFKNVSVISYSLLSMLTVIALKQYLHWISSCLILGNCVLSFGQLYFLEIRLYHMLLLLFLILSICNLVIQLILKYKHGQNRNVNAPLLNGILPLAVIGFVFFVKLFMLMKLVEMQSHLLMGRLAIIAAVLSAVALVIYILLVKDRSNKRQYFGAMVGTISCTFLLALLLPFGAINYANYAFDTSEPKIVECRIVDKQVRPGTGRNSSTRYYLVITHAGEKTNLQVHNMVYFQYDLHDTISLHAHEGALHYAYYEYRMDTIYIYK